MGSGLVLTTVLGSFHVVEQLWFSFFLSILTFDFDLIFGSFLTFWGPNGLLLGLGRGPNTVGNTHVVEQLYFSMFPWILTFDFDLILGSFLTFLGPNGLFLGLGRVRQLFGNYTCSATTLILYVSFNSGL